MQWFRWYRGTVEDGKFRAVARNARVTLRDVIAVWAVLLEEASHDEHRGVCTKNEDYMAAVLDFEDGVVEVILAAMERAGIVSVGVGAITISNWSKRQFESDADPTNAERQRRWRERQKEKQTENVTGTQETRQRNALRNPPDTETETDKTTTPPPPSEAHPPQAVGDADAVPVSQTDPEPEPEKPKQRGSRLPPDWRPDEHDVAFARKEGLTDDEIERCGDEFRDFWTAQPGQRGRKLDWNAVWRNRIREVAPAIRARRTQAFGPAGRGDRRQPASFTSAAMRAVGRG